MQGHPKVVEALRGLLGFELTEINLNSQSAGYSRDSKGSSVLGIFRSAGPAADRRKRGQASNRNAAGRPGRVKGSWWFVPVQSTPPKTVRLRVNRSVLDEMAAISATPIGVEDIEVAVGVEGLRQDWSRVGGYLRTSMDGLRVDPPDHD